MYNLQNLHQYCFQGKRFLKLIFKDFQDEHSKKVQLKPKSMVIMLTLTSTPLLIIRKERKKNQYN